MRTAVPRGGGWASDQKVVCTYADGEAGAADGADGEADYELCLSAQSAFMGTETAIGTGGPEQQ